MDGQFISCVPTTIKVEQMKLIKNLIQVKIPEDQLAAADLKNGLKIEVKSERPFVVNSYWIVKIFDVHREIEKDWLALHNELVGGKFLCDNNKSLYQTERRIYHTIRDQVLCEIRPPSEIDTTKLKAATPRDFYPLVIIVTCLDEENQVASPVAWSGTDAAASIHLVHIKDSIVSIKSHVIKQYIKQVDGRILDISQLYADESACFICFEEASDDLKLFCLLPCRHSPICSNCITRIRDCPQCRSPIASVFDVNAPQAGGEAGKPNASNQIDAIDPSLSHLYDDATNGRPTSGRRKSFLSSLKSMFGL